MPETVKRIVTGPRPRPGEKVDPTTHTYAWQEVDPDGAPGAKIIHTANYGELIEVSPAEAARGDKLGVLSTVEDAAKILATDPGPDAGGGPWEPANDEDLADMNATAVIAYMNAVPEDRHDDELERVLDLENERTRPRSTVLALGNE